MNAKRNWDSQVSGNRIFTDYAKSLIRFKARQLSERSDFSRSDRKDLEQEMWLALITQLESFDPERASLNTFVDRIVISTICRILRDRACLKRIGGSHSSSIDVERRDREDGNETTSTCPTQDDRTRHRNYYSADEATRREDQEAVEHALQQLPAEFAKACRHVMGGSILGASREMNCSRRQIRNALAKAGHNLKRAGFK